VWLERCRESSVEQYYIPTNPAVPTSYVAYQKPGTRIGLYGHDNLANRVFQLISWQLSSFDGSMAGLGISAELQNEFIDWAKTVWPANGDGTGPWDGLRPHVGKGSNHGCRASSRPRRSLNAIAASGPR
jgi:hypothetical protein